VLTIRQARPADAAVIADFNSRLAWETEGRRLASATVRRGVEALLGDPAKGIYFVAELEGVVVGQLLITYEWSDWRNGNFWWIQSVYVAAEFRQGGVFRALFEQVRQQAKARPDVCGLRLYVESNNGRAQSAYERLGMSRAHYDVFELDWS
jgi:ribosomal protein S18 acetylase RimI-like enzyme